MSVLKSVDLGRFVSGSPAERRAEAERFDRACRETGFVMLRGHGVPAGLVEASMAAARRYFALPLAEKARLAPETPEHFNGYFGKGSEQSGLLYSPVNLVQYREKFMISRPVPSTAWDPATPEVGWAYQPNRWPELAGFRDTYLAFYDAMERVSAATLGLAAAALGLPEDWFNDKFDQHESTGSWMHYPAQIVPPKGDEMRSPAHVDVGSLTFLIQDDGADGDGKHPGGLQLLHDGAWHDLQPRPGTILMNVGETLRRWTNDRWTASKHRVVNPPREQADTARLSLGFFQKPNFWARMDPIPGTEDAGPGQHAGLYIGQYMRHRMLHSVGHQALEPLLRDAAAAAVKQVALA